ncbi:MAG: hypothetical protein RI957_965, partial [Verrucomicrobiota bacterium]
EIHGVGSMSFPPLGERDGFFDLRTIVSVVA